jgi:hypothetical protein
MHAIIIVAAAQVAEANRLARQHLDPTGGDNFTIGLNATGSMDDPVTHYWCAPEVSGEGWAKIEQLKPMFPGIIAERYDADTQPTFPWTLLTRLGLKVRQSTIGFL